MIVFIVWYMKFKTILLKTPTCPKSPKLKYFNNLFCLKPQKIQFTIVEDKRSYNQTFLVSLLGKNNLLLQMKFLSII